MVLRASVYIINESFESGCRGRELSADVNGPKSCTSVNSCFMVNFSG